MSRVKMNNFIKIKHLIHRAKNVVDINYYDSYFMRKILRGNSYQSNYNASQSGRLDYTLFIDSKRVGIRVLLVKV